MPNMFQFGLLVVVSITITTVASDQTLHWNHFLENNDPEMTHSREREARFFPLFSVVRFANSECQGSNHFNGTCFTRRECFNYGGTPSGTCANGLGICCVFQKSCGSSTNMNNTYFINPEYPRTYQGGEQCTMLVQRCNSNICQLRLDFLDFSICQPNASGGCDNDFFLVYGAASRVPRICGKNTNQHVYVDFNGASPISISIDTNTDYTAERRWNIRIQQIACDSIWRAPNGCLQYYKEVSRVVSSFNYDTAVNPRAPDIGTREMANLNYGICIRMALGYCGIEWAQVDTNSFSISGDTGSLDPSIIGTDLVAESGSDCTKDFVIIPNPRENGNAVNVDRFCGNGFVTKTSNLKPFVLYVVTNEDEEQEVQNRGFLLMYRQLACSI